MDFSLRREVDWFPVPSEEDGRNAVGPQVMGFTIDRERRMVFARVMRIEDPDAPPAAPRLGGTGEQALQRLAQAPDGVIEVFTFDGDLVASTRFDDGREMPFPLGAGAPGNLWYRTTDGITQSIEILRPELVAAGLQPA